MWPFQKKKVIDLTKYRIPEKKALKKEEYIGLTGSGSSEETALGFLGNIASASSSISDDGSSRHLKVKIEDAEYKLETLRKKLDQTLDRLDVAEKKINRIEGRA